MMNLSNQSNGFSSLKEIEALLCGFWLSDLANVSSYLFHHLLELNWVGFYLDDGEKLRLGPFMGKPACLEIPHGKGVCGASFYQKKSLIVDDVDQFPGHIRCDIETRSELVVPFYINNQVIGVLDLDSSRVARFAESDKIFMEKILEILSSKIQEKSAIQGRLI